MQPLIYMLSDYLFNSAFTSLKLQNALLKSPKAITDHGQADNPNHQTEQSELALK